MSKARKERGSLNYQIHQRMEQLKCLGESRHQAKEEYKQMVGHNKTHNKTVGMHSHGTYNAYKSSCKAFTNFLKEQCQEVKNISDIDDAHVKKFIECREEQGYSAHTYSKDLAALNKMFNTDIKKVDCDVANRSYKAIENNRDLKEHHKNINLDNYRDVRTFIEGTGVRRSSLEKIDRDSFKYDHNGVPERVCVVEKGGRYREAEIRESYREYIQHQIQNAGENKLFEHIPNRFPCHRFRQEYAEKLYEEKLEKLENAENREQYRGYDREILREVSKNLGHNREDVIVYHYLYVK